MWWGKRLKDKDSQWRKSSLALRTLSRLCYQKVCLISPIPWLVKGTPFTNSCRCLEQVKQHHVLHFNHADSSSDITGQVMPTIISDLGMPRATSLDQSVRCHDSWPSGVCGSGTPTQPRGAGVASKGFWVEYRWWSLSYSGRLASSAVTSVKWIKLLTVEHLTLQGCSQTQIQEGKVGRYRSSMTNLHPLWLWSTYWLEQPYCIRPSTFTVQKLIRHPSETCITDSARFQLA